MCFMGWSEKQDGHPGLWLAETFSTSPLKPLNGIQRNLIGSKFLMSSTKFVFLGLIEKKQYGRPGLWFAETYLNFSSETAEQNSAKLDRKQDLSALYQVCVFWAEKWIKMATLANPSIYILIYNPFQNFSRIHCTQVSDSGPLGLLLHFNMSHDTIVDFKMPARVLQWADLDKEELICWGKLAFLNKIFICFAIYLKIHTVSLNEHVQHLLRDFRNIFIEYLWCQPNKVPHREHFYCCRFVHLSHWDFAGTTRILWTRSLKTITTVYLYQHSQNFLMIIKCTIYSTLFPLFVFFTQHTCQPSRILRESPAISMKFIKNPALTIAPDGNSHSTGILRSPPAGKLHLTKVCFTPFARVCHASPPGERHWPPIKVIKTHVAQSNWLHNLIIDCTI